MFWDSETLGSGYWTNNTDSRAELDLKQLFWKSKGEKVQNTFMQYQTKTNQVKISFLRDQMMDFVGNHTIELKLFDKNSGRSNGGLAAI
jgi:hypothetical protein